MLKLFLKGARRNSGNRGINIFTVMLASCLLAVIDSAGRPALRIVSVIAVLIFADIGACIFQRRHQLFDLDPEIPTAEDGPAVRHIRLELILVVWGALMLAMLATCFEIWRA